MIFGARFYVVRVVSGLLLAVLMTLPFQSSAYSQNDAVTAESTPRQVAQARKRAVRPYFIEFRSRSALSYGHTFAVYGRVGQKIQKSQVVGLHPATESSIPWMIGHVVMVPSETGASDGDTEDQYVTARYRILLTEPEYRALVARLTEMKANSPMWHAVLYNCNAFVGDIAKYLGLKTPTSTMLMPKEYITSLKDLNGGRREPAAAISGNIGTLRGVAVAVRHTTALQN